MLINLDQNWLTPQSMQGPRWGEWDPESGHPGQVANSWWVGQDSDLLGGAWVGIGPNGPGSGWGAPYAWQGDYPGIEASWWNTPRSGIGLLPAITRCTSVIVNPVIRTQWAVEAPSGPLPIPLWMSDPMLCGSAPGPIGPLSPITDRIPAYNFWSTLLTHAMWWGHGGFLFVEAADGSPLPGSLMLVNPFMFARHEWVDREGVRRQSGRWAIDPRGEQPLITDTDGRFVLGGQQWRMVVLCGSAPCDHSMPEGVLIRHFDTFRMGAAIRSYHAGTFVSGVPSGYLSVSTPNLTQDQADQLKQRWMQAHGSDKRSVAVLNATTSYTPIAINPVEADTDKAFQANLVDVAHAFGLSAMWLDASAGSSMTYANLTDRRRDLLDTTLTGWGQSLCEVLSSCLPFGTTVRVNWATFTAPDLVQQIPVMVSAVAAGLIDRAEARKLMGLQDMNAGPPPPRVDQTNLPTTGGLQ